MGVSRNPSRVHAPHGAVLILAIATGLIAACLMLPAQALANYGDPATSYPASQGLGTYGAVITGAEIPDGIYKVDAVTSSRMCVMYGDTALSESESALIQVSGGTITAAFYMSKAYTRLYMGTAEEAAALAGEGGVEVEGAYLVGDPAEGYTPHAFAITVPALNSEFTMSTYSGGQNPESGKWYTRTVVFKATDEVYGAIEGKTDDGGSSGGDPAGDDPAGSDPAGDNPAGDDPAGEDPAGDEPSPSGKGDDPAGADDGTKNPGGEGDGADQKPGDDGSKDGASSTEQGAPASDPVAEGDSENTAPEEETVDEEEAADEDAAASAPAPKKRGVLMAPSMVDIIEVQKNAAQAADTEEKEAGLSQAQVIALVAMGLFGGGAAWSAGVYLRARRGGSRKPPNDSPK